MIRRGAFLIALVAPLSIASADVAWDGPVLNVQNGSVVLPVRCEKGKPVEWTPEVLAASHGLKSGDKVSVIHDRGLSPEAGTLGETFCFEGACLMHYASIRLSAPGIDAKRITAVAPPDLFRSESDRRTAPIRMTGGDGRASWRLSQSADSPLIEMRSAPNVHGRQSIEVRFFRKAGDRRPTTWTEIGEFSTGGISPSLAVASADGSHRVLIFQWDGVCCPQDLGQTVIRLAPDFTVAVGRRFQAGGQPCD